MKALSGGGNPLPGSAMALYSFSENTGTTAADLSGNSRMINLNSATWATGHTGSGITNTTSNVGGKAVFTAPADVITIMGWIKPTDLTLDSTRPAFGFVDNGNSTGCMIFTQRGDYGTHNVLQGNIRIGANPLYSLHGPALTVGAWTHVAITYDGSTAILYKDGASVASVSATGNIGQGDALCVAGWMDVGAYSSNTVVDDVRVYHAVLTPGQIVTGMNTPVA
jgi:hypothetical protein